MAQFVCAANTREQDTTIVARDAVEGIARHSKRRVLRAIRCEDIDAEHPPLRADDDVGGDAPAPLSKFASRAEIDAFCGQFTAVYPHDEDMAPSRPVSYRKKAYRALAALPPVVIGALLGASVGGYYAWTHVKPEKDEAFVKVADELVKKVKQDPLKEALMRKPQPYTGDSWTRFEIRKNLVENFRWVVGVAKAAPSAYRRVPSMYNEGKNAAESLGDLNLSSARGTADLATRIALSDVRAGSSVQDREKRLHQRRTKILTAALAGGTAGAFLGYLGHQAIARRAHGRDEENSDDTPKLRVALRTCGAAPAARASATLPSERAAAPSRSTPFMLASAVRKSLAAG